VWLRNVGADLIRDHAPWRDVSSASVDIEGNWQTVRLMRSSGDGFVRCSDGRVRWGVYGAAGVVFATRHDAGWHVMMQLRSAFSHEGGTWSCAGGALDRDESALEGSLREASEEVGAIPATHRVLGEYVFQPADDWSYTTLVVEVDEAFGASINFETDAVEWFDAHHIHTLELHSGFAAAWPHVRAILAEHHNPG
jgi:8-oxo-dGTP diphosphatase